MKVFLIAFATAIVLTAILTWPFAINLPFYYTDQGDYATHGSIFWWNQDSSKTGRIFKPQEYWRGYMFYPHPYSFAFANTSIFPSLVFSPIYWVTGSLPFSLNLYTFLTFVATFVAAFYFIEYFMTLGFRGPAPSSFASVIMFASLIGAFVFTFNPQTMTRFPHHLDILGKYFLPLIFLFGYKFLSRPNLKDAVLLSIFITLNSLTTNYFQIFVAVMLPLAALPFIFANLKKGNWGYLGNLGRAGFVILIFLPVILYFNLPFLEFSQKEGAVRSIGETVFFSGRVSDWLSPGKNNLIYGEWAKRLEKIREPKDNRGILNYEEHTLFIGIVSSILFFFGLKPFLKAKLVHWFFLLPLILSFVFTFGPYFPPNDEGTGLKLPFYYLWQTLPFMKGIRSPTRFEYILLIPFALIAAFGVRWVLEKSKNIMIITFITIMTIILLESFTINDFSGRSRILTQLMEERLQKLPFLKDKAVLHLPIYTTEDADVFGKNSYALNWVTKTHERVMNGNSGFLPPDNLGMLFSLREKLDDSALKRLRVLGVSYVVFHKNLLTQDDLAGIVPNLKLYEKDKIYEDEDTKIIDLGKFDFETKICDFRRDFSIKPIESQNFETDTPSVDLILQNNNDCFLPSIYEDRYKRTRVVAGGKERTARYLLPLLIGPYEQIVVGEAKFD